jgi:phosphate transport system permease protein
VVFIRYDPSGLLSGFTAMPVQIFNMVSKPQEELQVAAAAGIILLLVLLLLMNVVAVLIRNKFQRRW